MTFQWSQLKCCVQLTEDIEISQARSASFSQDLVFKACFGIYIELLKNTWEGGEALNEKLINVPITAPYLSYTVLQSEAFISFKVFGLQYFKLAQVKYAHNNFSLHIALSILKTVYKGIHCFVFILPELQHWKLKKTDLFCKAEQNKSHTLSL